MTKTLWLLLSLLLAPVLAQAAPTVTLHTSHGDIRLELYPDKAPVTVENFLRYAREGFYDGTIFHRSIRRFVIQGGGFTPEFEEKPTHDPIVNEADNGLNNERWTVAMARTSDPDSATSQFYINVGMNLSLDRRGGRDGYAVFGKVVEGQEVVRDINNLSTHTLWGMPDVPKEVVLLERVTIHAPQSATP